MERIAANTPRFSSRHALVIALAVTSCSTASFALGADQQQNGLHAGRFPIVQLRDTERRLHRCLSEKGKAEPQPGVPGCIQHA
jgi:hypothetical protein